MRSPPVARPPLTVFGQRWNSQRMGGDPLSFVISMNLKRRHLDASQRAMVVASIANLPKGSHPPVGGSSATQEAAAKIMNVSVRSGQRARYVNSRCSVVSSVTASEHRVGDRCKQAEFNVTVRS